VATLDDLLQTRLFSERIEIRPKDDLQRDTTERVRVAHLIEGAADRPDLFGERLLDPDVAALGADRVCGYGEPFEDLLGVGPEQETILEGCRFPLRAVAHGEPRSRARRPYRSPLLAGWETRAASTTKATLGHLLDDCLGGNTQRSFQTAASAGIQIRRE
jgi:hypothetical protein